MARHHDRERVPAVREADGTHGVRLPDACRELAVADCRAERDPAEFVPDAPLEQRALGREHEIERLPPAREVLLELTPGLRGGAGDGLRARRLDIMRSEKPHLAERSLLFDEW